MIRSERLRHLAPLVLALTACLATAACGDKTDKGAPSAKGGDVLPRSISDDMLPYDTVRSQSGPDASAAPEDGTRPASGHPSDSGSAAAPVEGAPAEPAETAGDAAPVTSAAE